MVLFQKRGVGTIHDYPQATQLVRELELVTSGSVGLGESKVPEEEDPRKCIGCRRGQWIEAQRSQSQGLMEAEEVEVVSRGQASVL